MRATIGQNCIVMWFFSLRRIGMTDKVLEIVERKRSHHLWPRMIKAKASNENHKVFFARRCLRASCTFVQQT